MILEDIANILESECKEKGLRKVSEKTGVSSSTLRSIMNGCGFNLNAKFIAALASLGYELHVVKRRK